MAEQPVVVTGVGGVAPGSRGAMSWWERLLAGESALAPLAEGAAAARERLGAEVELLDRRSLGLSRKELRYLDAVSTYGLVASREAMADAGLGADSGIERDEIGFAIGMFSGPLSLSRHETDVNLFTAAVSAYYGSIIGNITIPLGICGPSLTHLNLDLAGSDAIGYGYELVRHGKARAVLAGGADSGFNPYVLAQFERSGLLANGNGSSAGIVLGEGAAVLVLESRESAERRGREIYAEVLGYHKAEEGAAAGAIAAALERAAVARTEVDCIMASATGSAEVDRRESEAVAGVFGEAAAQPPATHITWAVGHTLGAAGALQAVASALALSRQRVPAVASPRGSAAASGLNLVAPPGSSGPVEVVLQNGFGLCGQASFLVLGRDGRGAARG